MVMHIRHGVIRGEYDPAPGEGPNPRRQRVVPEENRVRNLSPGYFLTCEEIDIGLGLQPGEAKRVIDKVLKKWQTQYQVRVVRERRAKRRR